MPIRALDPLADPTLDLDPKVNPYLARLRDGAENGTLPLSFGPHLAGHAGTWRERFTAAMGRPCESLILEIGCHHGETLIPMADSAPDTGFVGIDITFKRVVKTALKAKAAGLGNVKSALANANGLESLFGPGELDGVVVFFPDPWAKKKRQRKHRLLNEEFLGVLSSRLKEGGFLWLKTDQFGYFADVAAATAGVGLAKGQPAHPLASRPYSSCFERHFHGEGFVTFSGQWVKIRR